MQKLLLFLLLFSSTVLYGADERFTTRVNAFDEPIVVGTSLEIEDDKYFEVLANNSNFMIGNVSCFIKMGLEEGITSLNVPSFDMIINVEVTGYNSSGSTILGTFPLHLLYSQAAGGVTIIEDIYLASHKIDGYHKLEAKVDGIVNNLGSSIVIPENVFFELELVVDRYYFLEENSSLEADFELGYEFLNKDVDSDDDELNFYWTYIKGAEYYELEWVHINNYEGTIDASFVTETKSASNVDFIENEFKYNSTRIRTSKQFYNIPLIFDKGFIVYRLRPVGIWDNEDDNTVADNEVFGKWSTWVPLSNTLLDTRKKVSHFPHYINIDKEHEEKINWQFKSVFAEGGKKKDVVTYFDGSLRTRQTATKISSNDKVIVGETIYDAEGRGAVTILPVPTRTNGNNTPDALGFHPSFNNNTSGTAYSLLDFDVEVPTSTSCGVILPGALNNSGAGLYYGNNVGVENNWQDHIADAGGYPFVQTDYMPDNTGRIRSQSGVGIQHALSSHHETVYMYSQPYQEELDRLFGTNVGYKSRYKKNLVIDANGQISVSYLDPFGRVIATALVGISPSNMTGLVDGSSTPLSNTSSTLRVDLLSKVYALDVDNTNDDNQRMSSSYFGNIEDELVFSSQQVVYQDNSELKYKYTADSKSFVGCSGDLYPYKYDLNITLVDNCGVEKLTVPLNNVLIDGSIASYGTADFINDAIDGADGLKGVDLEIGTYTIEKKLAINKNAVSTYAAQNIVDGQAAGCIKTLVDFTNLIVGEIDFSGCDMTCDECIVNLGSESDYIAYRKLDFEWTTLTSSEQNTLIAEFVSEYSVLIAECDDLCDTGEVTYCEVLREQMLLDVSPHGQYGAIDNDMSLSVFSLTNQLPATSTAVNWQNPSTHYINSNGQTAKVIISTILGVNSPAIQSGVTTTIDPSTGEYYVFPEDLVNLSDFLEEWDITWAASLLEAHPEFCYLGWCSGASEMASTNSVNSVNYTTEEFDNKLISILTYDDAMNGAMNDLGMNLTDLANLFSSDPFFLNTSSTFLPSSALREAPFTDNQVIGSTSISLWELAVYIVKYSNYFGNSPAVLDFNVSLLSTDDKNQIWNSFKMLYLSEKQKFYQDWAHEYAVIEGCYNGCIGSEAYNPFEYDFATNNITNSNLPCSSPNAYLFADKEPRFFGINTVMDQTFGTTINDMVDNVNSGIYDGTGICPQGFELINFLKGIANEGNIVQPTQFSLNGKPYFGVQLYAGLGGSIDPDFSFVNNSVEDLMYSTTLSGVNNTVLNIDIDNNDVLAPNSCQDISLTLPIYSSATTGNYTWSNYGPTGSWEIIDFQSFYYVDQSPMETYNFQIIAIVQDPSNLSAGIQEVLLNGSTCLMVGQCEVNGETGDPIAGAVGAIQESCELHEEAVAMVEMFNYMLIDNGTTTPYFFTDNLNLPSSPVNTLLTPGAYQFLDWYASIPNTSSNFTWNISSVGNQRTIDITGGPNGYYKIILDDLPIHVQAFTGLTAFQAPNFKLNYVTTNGTVGETDGSILFIASSTYTNVALGLCGDCNSEEVQTTFELGQFIEELITNGSTAAVPDELINYFGLEGEESNVSISQPTIEGVNYTYSLLHNTNKIADFRLFPSDGTTDIAALNILRVNKFEGNIHKGPGYFEMEFLQVNQEYVQIEGESPVPVVPCPCTDQIDQPMTCTSAYDYYLTEMATINITANPDLNLVSQADFCLLDYQLYLESFLTLVSNGISSGYSSSDINDWPSGYALSTDPFSGYIIEMKNIPNYLSYDSYLYALPIGVTPLSSSEFEDVAYCEPCQRLFELHNPTNISIDQFCGTITPGCNENPGSNIDLWDDYTWVYSNNCQEELIETAGLNAINQYQDYIDMVEQEFITNYINGAMEDVVETFELEAPDNEYNYTLYYYDQAGNLIRTVPPNGVSRINSTTELQNIKEERFNETTSTFDPIHGYLTSYSYNALNQLVYQRTPDGGDSRFWYDGLGRLVASQNAEQKNSNAYSYTKFDGLGRIVEVGEIHPTSGMNADGSPSIDLDDFSYPDNWSLNRFEITRTYYDRTLITNTESLNLRNRIGSVTFIDHYVTDEDMYQSAYHYSYDIHGNVKKMTQEIRRSENNQASSFVSVVEYEYDLVSGNVKKVLYNQGRLDQFFHKYEYDADNRITRVFTSDDNVNWHSDSKYFYYDHGPLARTEVGNDKVQGTDYAYTINGWLKSVNGVKIDPKTEMGKDSRMLPSNLNRNVGKDAFGFALNYNDNDYSARTANGSLFMDGLQAALPTAGQGLFNGNIAQMATALVNTDEELIDLIANDYQYDQLNRIKKMDSWKVVVPANTTEVITNYSYSNTSSQSVNNTQYSYDHNGNLLTLSRKDNIGNTIDDFEYFYDQISGAEVSGASVFNNTAMTNRLDHVVDHNGAATIGDIGNTQLSNNYEYNDIGQLTKDVDEGISSIEWTVTGKVKKITRSAGSTLDDMEFIYDPMGIRVAKIVKPRTTAGNPSNENAWIYSLYTVDASGNTMGVYEKKHTFPVSQNYNVNEQYSLKELMIYGSSRTGLLNKDIIVANRLSTVVPNSAGSHYNSDGSFYDISTIISGGFTNSSAVVYETNISTTDFEKRVGKRYYEMKNHLGNVLSVLSDKKLVVDLTGNLNVDYMKPDVLSYSDYYPFGMLLPNRHESSNEYRYGFNGQEKDDEIAGEGNSYTAEFWQYDPRIGRRWNIDPIVKTHESPYVAFANNPIWFSDVDGADTLKMHLIETPSPNDKKYILFKVSFSHIQDGVESIVTTSKPIYFGMPRNEWEKKGNTQPLNTDISLIYETGNAMGQLYSKAWNENVIRIKGDVQYFHPASDLEMSKGCFLSSDYPIYKDLGTWTDDAGVSHASNDMQTSATLGSDIVSKSNLAIVRGVYDEAKAVNNDATFDFFLNMGTVATSRGETIQKMKGPAIKPIPTKKLNATSLD